MYKSNFESNYYPYSVIDIFCGSGGFITGDSSYKNVVRIKARPYFYKSSLMAGSLVKKVVVFGKEGTKEKLLFVWEGL